MVYPTGSPKLKHALQCTISFPPDGVSLISEMGFSNSANLFQKLEEEIPTSLEEICSVYSYADGPDYPGPLARALVILGFADQSLSLVRKIVFDENVPDCIHKCTVAVQLADPKHMQRLEPRHQKNSSSFAKLMKRLRQEEAVAIVGKDKLGRFGILSPMQSSKDTTDSAIISADDCAAYCFVGSVQDVMDFLTTRTSDSEPAYSHPSTSTNGLWPPQGPGDVSNGSETWKPTGEYDGDTGAKNCNNGTSFSAPWAEPSSDLPWQSGNSASVADPWAPHGTETGKKRSFHDMNENEDDQVKNNEASFHADSGAAAADAFYSGLTRSLDTRADSYIYHMRAFNGWVKAMQIQELDPRITKKGKVQERAPLRVLDLACGKGGDLTKWTLHERGMSNYVGIDVARGSLKDAAIRAREMRKRKKLSKAIFTCADLGADVPGRKKSTTRNHMQKLLTWSLEEESENDSGEPVFKMKRGGGISEKDRFDVVSIQFAIHYMMSSRQRARRFFHTVSQLLEIGGNLIFTTIDARVVVGHLMNLGLNFHFDDDGKNETFHEAVVEVGAGACQITFEPDVVKKLITTKSDGSALEDDLFGLQYMFKLEDGSDHSKGVGDAVNLPEWLTPLPIMEALAHEAGLVMEYAQNFHEFYDSRKDPSANHAAHLALYNMKVLNRSGSISKDEWSVSRLYAAMKFRKVRESSINALEDSQDEEQSDGEKESDDENEKAKVSIEIDPVTAKKMLPMAMMQAKRAVGNDVWQTLSSDEKKSFTQIELEKIARK